MLHWIVIETHSEMSSVVKIKPYLDLILFQTFARVLPEVSSEQVYSNLLFKKVICLLESGTDRCCLPQATLIPRTLFSSKHVPLFAENLRERVSIFDVLEGGFVLSFQHLELATNNTGQLLLIFSKEVYFQIQYWPLTLTTLTK